MLAMDHSLGVASSTNAASTSKATADEISPPATTLKLDRYLHHVPRGVKFHLYTHYALTPGARVGAVVPFGERTVHPEFLARPERISPGQLFHDQSHTSFVEQTSYSS